MHPFPCQTAATHVRASAPLLLALTLALSPAVTRGATSLQLGITPPTAANGFKRTAYLTWNAQSGCVYTVQSNTTLGDTSQWIAEESILATTSTVQWTAPSPIVDRKFYRVLLPSPQIAAVEPAVVNPGAAVTFYITGQCFDADLVLRINGVVQGNVSFTDSGLISTSFTPPVAGTYLFELVVGGQVASSFTVTCADALANPELVLQGPPVEPPAGPIQTSVIVEELEYVVERLEYDVKKVRSNKEDEFKELFQKIDKPIKKGSTMSIPPPTGGGGIRENDNVLFEVQDGKKGLNAVNVKLARSAAGDRVPRTQRAYSGSDLATAGINDPEWEHWEGVLNIGSSGQDGVNVFSGEVQARAVDLAIAGRNLDFVWARTYHSRLGRFDTNSNGWTFSYDIRCAQNSSGGIDVYDGTGNKDTYTLQSTGVYTCPGFFREGTLTGNVFRLTFADTGVWEFLPFDGSSTGGKLSRIEARTSHEVGHSLGLQHSTAGGVMSSIIDDLGRTNTIAYDSDGRLASVTDFSGRSVAYAYYHAGESRGCPGDLKSVTSPLGHVTSYTYTSGSTNELENHLLLSVTDALGQTVVQFVYDLNPASPSYLRCTSQQRGTSNAERITILPQVASPANHFAVRRCVVNDPVGNVTECFYDARNRCVMERQFTGRATPGELVTDTTNRPTGKLRTGDPDYYETRWTWNSDSLCTLATAPGGGQLQYVYQSDYDKSTPARKRADCRMLREIASSAVDLDGDGTPDVTERVRRYEYDPRFGSDPTPSYGKKIYVGNLPFSEVASGHFKGTEPGHGSSCPVNVNSVDLMKLMEQSSKSQKTMEVKDEISQSFITSATDPRGNVATAAYDANGNRVKVKFPQMPDTELDFTYNAYGQWTSITHAADGNGYRRVDTCSYYDSGPQTGMVEVMVASALTGGLSLTTAFEHDPRGNVTRCVDPLGRDWLFTYNALDQCVRAESPVNLTARCATDFSYDANDNLVQCSVELRDAVDAKTGDLISTFAYDTKNRLISITEPVSDTSNAVTGFTYDDNDQVTEIRSPLANLGLDSHNIQARQYDERGLLFQEIEAPGSPLQCTSQVDYDANGNPRRLSEGLEDTPGITTMEYDGFAGFDSGGMNLVAVKSKGTLFRLSSSSLQIASNKFYGNAASGGWAGIDSPQTAAAGSKPRRLVVLVGGADRPSKITDPMGNVTTFHYDVNDNLKVARHSGELNDVPDSGGNIRLAESRFDYDALDLCVTRHDLHFNPSTQAPVGDGEATTHIVRCPNGDCSSITDDLGHTTTFDYDAAGRVESVSVPTGKSVTTCYRDLAGNVTSMTRTDTSDLGGAPQVFSVTNVFDSKNRCVSSTDSAGNTSSCAYDSLDRVVRETDPNGNDSTHTYDDLGNCLTSTHYSGSSSVQPASIVRTSEAAYDVNSRCISSTDANGNTTSYAYDSLDHPVTITQADGTQESLVWSPRSNLIGDTDANGTTVTNEYDPCDRIIHRSVAVGGAAVATTTFENFGYDGCSQLVVASNDVSNLAFNHDSMGNAVTSTQDGLTTTCTFDAIGNCLSMTYPGGRVVSYIYNELDCVTNVATSQNGISFPALTSISYVGGRVASLSRANGVNTRYDWNGLVNPVNPAGDFGCQQISRVRHGTALDPSLLADVAATYSHTQSKSSQTDAVSGRGRVLTYDALDQLVGSSVHSSASTPPLETVYILDANGNRQQVTTGSVPADYTMDNTMPPDDARMNRYTVTPFGAQKYDANGNLSQSTSTAGQALYQYDYADRLVSVEITATPSSGGQSTTIAYCYDALGNRIASVSEAKPMAPRESKFLFSGGRVIEERVDGALSRIYVPGNMDNDPEHTSDLVAAFTASGDVLYYHCDELGNTVAVTDGGGNVLERYSYGDFGAVTFLMGDGTPSSATSSSVGNAYCWSGRRFDTETGLLNDDGGSYLDPQSGRAVRGKVKVVKDMGSGFAAPNNPWTGGSPPAMKKDNVKFFN